MGGEGSKAQVSTSSSAASQSRRRIAQNFVLVWVDASIDQSNKDSQDTLAQLRSVVNDVTICTQPKQCIQVLKDIDDEKAFVIISGSLGQHLVPEIHGMPQLDAVYIFCGNQARHEQWARDWVKIKGVHTGITPICEALQLAAKQCNEDSIGISFVLVGEGASGENLDKLEATFMYTQIFKEILLEIEFNAQSVKDLANYCRTFYEDNNIELNIIDEFERDYRPRSSIWWYTRECFTYQMLNRALRNLEADTIINMGFLIRDLHRQIEKLHEKQVSEYRGQTFIVYRGQSLAVTDFEKLRKTKGGLMSFNSFLSTSKNREVSRRFAKNALRKTNMVGVLFQMTIDPSVSSTPFADIRKVSYFQKEEEILFSMHTVFRIGEIKRIDSKDPLYQVELQLTSDEDPQLCALTERIRKETLGTGWQRLGHLLLKIGQFNKAEELYKVLLEQTTDESEKAHYYHQLGSANDNQCEYEKAISYFEKGLEIDQKILPPNHPDLAISYNNIGMVYQNMGENSKALLFYEKALEIYRKSLSSNDPHLATSYNNIGEVHRNMGRYSKALSFYEKALEIYQKSLPSNHPLLSTSYTNIGSTFDGMKQYSKALSYFEQALAIKQHSLPPNHHSIRNVQQWIETVKKKQ